jgi:hypothetical protein
MAEGGRGRSPRSGTVGQPRSRDRGRERRSHPRVSGPFDGAWDDGGGRKLSPIWDVSLVGCFIETVAGPPVGRTVSITADLPDGRLEATGEVVYSLPQQGFALRFYETSAGAEQVLAGALRRE